MNPFVKKYYLLIISFVLFVAAITIEFQLTKNHPEEKLTQKFQSDFLLQEKKLDKQLAEIIMRLDSGQHAARNYMNDFSYLQGSLEKEGLGYLILRKDEILFWSDSRFAFSASQNKTLRTDKLLDLPNGLYFAHHLSSGDLHVIGLIHLKNKFPFENQYLKNSFASIFHLPKDYQISLEESRNSVPVINLSGQKAFYLRPAGKVLCNIDQLYLPALLYLLCMVFLLFYARQVMKEYREIFILKMFALGGALFSFYWLHITLSIPGLLKVFSFWGPEQYASSSWIPSLGDFFLLSVFIFFWSINFAKEYLLPARNKYWALAISLAFSGLMYWMASSLIDNLVLDSNISLKLYRISDFDQYSLVAYLSIAFLLFGAFLVHNKIIQQSIHWIKQRYFLMVTVPLFLIFFSGSLITNEIYWHTLTLFLSVSIALFILKPKRRYSLSFIVLFVALFSIYSIAVIYKQIKVRDLQIQKLKAINLSSEHDPVGEILLTDIQHRMETDYNIPLLFEPPYDELDNYLIRNYFSGYFSKFDIQTTVCFGGDSLLVQPDNVLKGCYPFFDEMIARSGTKLTGCDFYHMNNMNGLTSYLGKMFYPVYSDSLGISIFIELNSKVVSEGIGFPELLMDQSLIKPDKYKNFSYAKYFNNELVNRNGEYLYNSYFLSYDITPIEKEFQIFSWDGYNHLVYNLGKNNYIIVSNQSPDWLDWLISFPYLFVFYTLFALSFLYAGNSSYRQYSMNHDLKFRIQAAIISVVLVSLMVVAAGTLFYNLQEYNKKHQQSLEEKMRSISEEISNRLSEYDEVTPSLHAWLLRELHKLSNIFETDINIYDFNGELLATSRPEIFNKGIISTRMNSVAYYQLLENYLANYFQPEQIGSLSYLSAYEPILNSKGDYMGFLNLPYFTREDSLNQEISTFIVAFINLYVLLFLASVIVAVILANQITRPLTLIRNKLKGIQLGKKSEQINYQGEDEIGALVKEYNRKVDELAESAELLAKTERELAWREMAKQIAHEIKNPLTPMKLHVQYLQRAKQEGMHISEEQFEKVTKTLIEQIDTLSDIATEFSNFAKIPRAKSELIDLVEKLSTIEELFSANPNKQISLQLNNIKELLIFADREQLSSALVNLIKNGLQAIPDDRQGQIILSLHRAGNKAIVSVCDNGTGIPDELQQRMFEPNFTTKTSGMGLGLSIVKNVVDNMQGRIWYETTLGEGTTFYIEIPVYTEK